MIQKITLKNYGLHKNIEWDNLGKINLIIGENGQGKSFILKAIYTGMKTIEAVGRGQNNRSATEILAEKLYWTFQTKTLGDIVRKGADEGLSFSMMVDGHRFSYDFGDRTTKMISSLINDCAPRNSNTVFIPAKEVLSICSIIRKSREIDSVFGFDDTYLDLVRAISAPTQRGKNFDAFAKSRKTLEKIVGGTVVYDSNSDTWSYRCGKTLFSIGATAEGVKKIAILDQLLGNRYLDDKSIIIFDEPESGIHPAALSELMDIIWLLAEKGIQIFIASHSYFVLKKACLLSLKNKASIPLLALNRDESRRIEMFDLIDGMPENEIVNESIRLYEEEVDEVL